MRILVSEVIQNLRDLRSMIIVATSNIVGICAKKKKTRANHNLIMREGKEGWIGIDREPHSPAQEDRGVVTCGGNGCRVQRSINVHTCLKFILLGNDLFIG